jgi:hypothetical protein
MVKYLPSQDAKFGAVFGQQFPQLRLLVRRSHQQVSGDRSGSWLTPCSTSWYSTRSAHLLRSPQAKSTARPSRRGCLPKYSAAIVRVDISASWRVRSDLRPRAFGDAIYLSLGRRQRSAKLETQRRTRRGPCLEAQRAGGVRGVCFCRRDPVGRVLTSPATPLLHTGERSSPVFAFSQAINATSPFIRGRAESCPAPVAATPPPSALR